MLTQPTITALHGAMVLAFESDMALDEFVELGFEFGFMSGVEGGSRNYRVLNLIKKVLAAGRMREFLAKAIEARPNNVPFVRAAQSALTELDATNADAALAVAGSLSQIQPGQSGGALRAALANLSGAFDQTAQRLDHFKTYKEVHDSLHDIQYQIYDRLVDDLAGFPDDAGAYDDVQQHLYALTTSEGRLASLAERPTPRQASIAGIAQKVTAIREALEKAYQGRSRSDAEAARKDLLILINREPVAVNRYLVQQISSIDLAGLGRQISAAAAGDPALSQLAAVGDEVTRLSHTLDARIDEHDAWQRVDDVVRLVSDQTGTDSQLETLSIYLDSIAGDVRALCGLPPIGRPVRMPPLATILGALESMVAIPEPGGRPLLQSFRNLRHLVRQRFYFVDKAMVEECRDLDKVSEELRRLADGGLG